VTKPEISKVNARGIYFTVSDLGDREAALAELTEQARHYMEYNGHWSVHRRWELFHEHGAKFCTGCSTVRTLSDFAEAPSNSDRHRRLCLVCETGDCPSRKSKPKPLALEQVPEEAPHKKCSVCHQDKPLTKFETHHTARDGHTKDCLVCRYHGTSTKKEEAA
jgi:hypothetical protein